MIKYIILNVKYPPSNIRSNAKTAKIVVTILGIKLNRPDIPPLALFIEEPKPLEVSTVGKPLIKKFIIKNIMFINEFNIIDLYA